MITLKALCAEPLALLQATGWGSESLYAHEDSVNGCIVDL